MEFYTCIHILQVKETKEGEASLKTKKQPSKARTRSGKMVFCKVHLLDGQLYETDVTVSFMFIKTSLS
jgi:hypothetical protein